MINNNLIKSCICGNETLFKKSKINGLDVLTCIDCGTIHQELNGWTLDQYVNFYKTDYHKQYQEKKGVVTYAERYEHDCQVADIRLESYKDFIKPGMQGLDIGSSNSAFVHRARAKNINCLGLEPGENIGDPSVTIRGTLETAQIESNHFDFVTMHDSIEHMINVEYAMSKVKNILKQKGILIVDLPDYFVDAGKHHWKYIEHLWMFSKSDLEDFLWIWGFDIVKVESPIPGKLVFFARKR